MFDLHSFGECDFSDQALVWIDLLPHLFRTLIDRLNSPFLLNFKDLLVHVTPDNRIEFRFADPLPKHGEYRSSLEFSADTPERVYPETTTFAALVKNYGLPRAKEYQSLYHLGLILYDYIRKCDTPPQALHLLANRLKSSMSSDYPLKEEVITELGWIERHRNTSYSTMKKWYIIEKDSSKLHQRIFSAESSS